MRAGKVTRKSKYGIQLDNVDEWFNWSRDMEDRSVTDLVQTDDVVQVDIVDDKFITSLTIVHMEPTSAPSDTLDVTDDTWVLKEQRLGRQTAVKAAAVVLAAYIGNHAGIERDDILQFYDDLLEKAGVFID